RHSAPVHGGMDMLMRPTILILTALLPVPARADFIRGSWEFMSVKGHPPAPRDTIADVIVQGNRRIPTEQIMGWIQTRPGQLCAPEVVEEDVRALYATDQFATVEADKRGGEDGPITVCFLVREFQPTVQKIGYLGAKHLSDEELNALTGLHLHRPCDPEA